MDAIIIISIALVLESIALLINTILLKKYLKPSKQVKEKPFNIDEYLNSYNFNIKLDGLVLELKDKYDNETIANKIYLYLVQSDQNCTKIEKNILLNYIKDVLRNYVNNYTNNKEPEINQFMFTEEINTSQEKNKTNIDNILNNFYK